MAVDGGNDQLRRLFQTRQRLVRVQTEIVLELRRHLAEHLNVRARTKKLLALSSDYDHLDTFVHARVQNSGIELLHHLI